MTIVIKDPIGRALRDVSSPPEVKEMTGNCGWPAWTELVSEEVVQAMRQTGVPHEQIMAVLDKVRDNYTDRQTEMRRLSTEKVLQKVNEVRTPRQVLCQHDGGRRGPYSAAGVLMVDCAMCSMPLMWDEGRAKL